MESPNLPFFIDLVARTDEARREFETNSKVLEIVANGLPVERYRKLLLELYHVVWHFNPVCAAATSRITDEHKQVRYFLYEHMQEEMGHEEWVLNDLAALGAEAPAALQYKPSPAHARHSMATTTGRPIACIPVRRLACSMRWRSSHRSMAGR